MLRHSALVLLLSTNAFAIRPFITDDARVVGKHLVQLETWLQLEDGVLQNWVSPSFGPTEWLEVSVGFVHGQAHVNSHDPYPPSAPPKGWGIGGPLVQAKLLLKHADANSLPGVAVAVGTLLPFGNGGFRAYPGFFVYAALTQNLGDDERVLIHLNLGAASRALETGPNLALLTGIGAQLRLFAGLHGIGEFVYGDAYTNIAAFAVQGGFRYIFNDHVQLDATCGSGVAGQPRPLWFSAGIRLVSWQLW